MNKIKTAYARKNGKRQLLFAILLAVLLVFIPCGNAVRIFAGQSGLNEAINPDLIYRNLEIEHGLHSVGVYDTVSEQFLYGENLDITLQIPGLSRLFLAGLSAEMLDLNLQVLISGNAALADNDLSGVPPDEIKLSEGQVLPLEYLIYRMLFYHSDGAAVAIAETLASDEESCIELMNSTAHDLGLRDTQISFIRAGVEDNDLSEADLSLQNTTTVTDLVRFMLSLQILPAIQEWLGIYEAFLIVDDGGRRLVSMRSPISHLWTLSEGQVQQAYNVQDTTSLTLTSGQTKEGFSIITVAVSQGKGNLIQNTTQLYSAIDNYYETSPLVSAGEKMEGLRERAENGDIFELVYLETIYFLHPEDDLFLTQDIQYQGNPPYLLPLTAGTITGQVVFTLKNGMKISVDVGPDRDILSSRSQVALFLQNLNNNPNLAWLILLLVVVLILIMAYYLLRNIFRILYYWRHIWRSGRRL